MLPLIAKFDELLGSTQRLPMIVHARQVVELLSALPLPLPSRRRLYAVQRSQHLCAWCPADVLPMGWAESTAPSREYWGAMKVMSCRIRHVRWMSSAPPRVKLPTRGGGASRH